MSKDGGYSDKPEIRYRRDPELVKENEQLRKQLKIAVDERQMCWTDRARIYHNGNAIERKLRAEINTLFDTIKHGDEKHRQWLKEAINSHFAGKQVPKPE